MHNTNDDILINYCPDSLQEEVNRHIRLKNKNESDHHVIRVYDKPWRSQRVSKWLFYMFIFIILLMVSLLYS